MPKFKVTKGHDAWVYYEAIVEADSIEEANEKMTWKSERDELEWFETGADSKYDHSEFFPDLTEEVDDDEILVERKNYALTEAEHSTILAALRVYKGVDYYVEDIRDVATNGGSHDALTLEEIDQLCEALNV